MSAVLWVVAWLLCGVLAMLLAARWGHPGAPACHPALVVTGPVNLAAVVIVYAPWPSFDSRAVRTWLTAYHAKHWRPS